MSRRYLDVTWQTSTLSTPTVQPNLNNSIDIKGRLTIQDQELTGDDVRELKAMIGFLRHAIASDPRMHELWIAHQAREKILR